MPVETFDVKTFDKKLPRDSKKGGVPIFVNVGMIDGEQCWAFTLSHGRVRILIRSSIDATGVSAECGGDSIRIIIEKLSVAGFRPIGKGPDAYTTREKGWPKRLEEKLRETFKRAAKIKGVFSPEENVAFCKSGKNVGRPMVYDAGGFNRWLDQ